MSGSGPRPVALVPGVPALLPEHASLDDPVADLRAACRRAVAVLGPRVAVVAPDRPSGRRVAAHLVAAAGAAVVEVHDAASGVLVVGNGSATRTDRAPGHFDDRAAAFDDALRAALLAPDPEALRAVDASLAEELWADVGGLRALGGLLTAAHRVRVELDDDPFGVQYWALSWT